MALQAACNRVTSRLEDYGGAAAGSAIKLLRPSRTRHRGRKGGVSRIRRSCAGKVNLPFRDSIQKMRGRDEARPIG